MQSANHTAIVDVVELPATDDRYEAQQKMCWIVIYMKYVAGFLYENNARDPLWWTRLTNGKRIFASWNCVTCVRLHLLAAIGSTLMICKTNCDSN